MEEAMPEIYKQLDAIQEKLEDIIGICKIWSLPYKRVNFGSCKPVTANVRCRYGENRYRLIDQGMIDEKTALNRIEPNKLESCFTQYSIKKPRNRRKYG